MELYFWKEKMYLTTENILSSLCHATAVGCSLDTLYLNFNFLPNRHEPSKCSQHHYSADTQAGIAAMILTLLISRKLSFRVSTAHRSDGQEMQNIVGNITTKSGWNSWKTLYKFASSEVDPDPENERSDFHEDADLDVFMD